MRASLEQRETRGEVVGGGGRVGGRGKATLEAIGGARHGDTGKETRSRGERIGLRARVMGSHKRHGERPA